MITSTSSAAWTTAAPCAGLDGYVPSEQLVRSKPSDVMKACGPLMEGCAELCPFVLQCYELVRPEANRFDGVCAARTWVNGKPVAVAAGAPVLSKLVSQAGTCGTSSGVKAHQRLGEPLCGKCRVTAQRAGVRSAGAASIRKRATRGRREARVAS